MTWRDSLTFLRATGADPSLVGAIAPSGPALTRLMTREIGSHSGPVVELGPGTGVFTHALLSQGVRETDLTLVECCEEFAIVLREKFPKARVLQMDAGRLHQEELCLEGAVGAIVSGLPLLNMSPARVLRILRRAFRWLRPGGAIYQFTYGPRCPVPRPCLERMGLTATCTGRALVNLPPASVYRISKGAEVSEFDRSRAGGDLRSGCCSPRMQPRFASSKRVG